ncbi:MAG: HRDC domain-containing protein, partial [Gammaproteobacteria bacterium]|nr:HRDC domain-containing protein [Gammaproteobacteria bacterium]
DYRELLSPEDFAVYARLRTLRNQLAETEGTPAYAIFTNEQLANIARLPHPDRASIGAIEGIGEKRLDRYVDTVLAVLRGADGPHQSH